MTSLYDLGERVGEVRSDVKSVSDKLDKIDEKLDAATENARKTEVRVDRLYWGLGAFPFIGGALAWLTSQFDLMSKLF